jgi:unsaturated chondroitin disaccharide hydrolase
MFEQQPIGSLPQRYRSRPDLALHDVEAAINAAIDRTRTNVQQFSDAFPAGSSEDLRYERTDGMYLWTPSFWTGILWLAYEASDDERFRTVAEEHREHYRRRLINGRTNHDIGFLYSLSAVAESKVTGNHLGEALGVQAAADLADRYLPQSGIIQAWGDVEDPEDEWEHGRMIADTMMNVPLLLWAGETTGENRYRQVAVDHASATAEYIVRDDGSSFHTFKMDVDTGDPIGGETHQGHADDSTWARGQAWCLYGFPIVYRYTGYDRFLETGIDVADYYLGELPEDSVPFWDLDLAGPDVERDSSAAAIAACGLLELATQIPAADPRQQYYENAALETIQSLADAYATAEMDADGLLAHGVHNHPAGDGIDECCLWGDYYYFEALMKAGRGIETYW